MKNNNAYNALLNLDESQLSEAEQDALIQQRADVYVSPLEILVDRVVYQIRDNLSFGNTESLSELLETVPQNILFGFLPESEVVDTVNGKVRRFENETLDIPDDQKLPLFTVKSWIHYVGKTTKASTGDANDYNNTATYTDIENAKKYYRDEIRRVEMRRVDFRGRRRYAKVQLCQASTNENGFVYFTGEVLDEKDLS